MKTHMLDLLINSNSELSSLYDEVFNHPAISYSSSVVKGDNGELIAKIPLPGIDPANVSLSFESERINVSVSEENKKQKLYFRTSPKHDGSKTKAVHKHGLLTITVPLKKESTPSKIAISVE